MTVYCFYPAYFNAEFGVYYKCVTVVAENNQYKTVVTVNYHNRGITSIDGCHRGINAGV
jgi:hypothetical protein